MKTQYIETPDGRFLKVEGGGNSVSVANAISKNPDPHFGPGPDEEPLGLPSLNNDYSGQGVPPSKPPKQSVSEDDAPLGLPGLSFASPQRNAKQRKPTKPSLVTAEKNDGPLPLPSMEF